MHQQTFIHPCIKGFFIVEFKIEEDQDLVLSLGLWFWGNSGLFMKPWSPSFNPASDTLLSSCLGEASQPPFAFLGFTLA